MNLRSNKTLFTKTCDYPAGHSLLTPKVEIKLTLEPTKTPNLDVFKKIKKIGQLSQVDLIKKRDKSINIQNKKWQRKGKINQCNRFFF